MISENHVVKWHPYFHYHGGCSKFGPGVGRHIPTAGSNLRFAGIIIHDEP